MYFPKNTDIYELIFNFFRVNTFIILLQRPTNELPTLHHKFKRLVTIAGKPFRYV